MLFSDKLPRAGGSRKDGVCGQIRPAVLGLGSLGDGCGCPNSKSLCFLGKYN
jgi:hypothetical protein